MIPVFLIGEQRSGSNLLRLILNNNLQLAAPHPPHILQRFMPLLPLYGDLEVDENFKLLIQDVLELVRRNPIAWDIKIEKKDILHRVQKPSLIAIFVAIMDIYATQKNASHWLCKSMQNIKWADVILEHLEAPKFIHLYRDPRDVVLSFSNAIVGNKNPYCITKQWVELQELCFSLQAKIKEDQFMALSYESLIKYPEKSIAQICEFLAIEFDENMLHYYIGEEAKKSAESSSLWENLSKPILANNVGKYRCMLSNDDIIIIESLAEEMMHKLEYKLSFRKDKLINKFSKYDISNFEKENEFMKSIQLDNADAEDRKRRDFQLQWLEEIKHRADPIQGEKPMASSKK